MKSKRLITILLTVFLTILMVGCGDKKVYNNLFTVIFYTGSDSTYVQATYIPSIENVEKGKLVERPEDPIAPGMNFLGWYKEKEGINEWDFATDIITKSTVLYAKWNIMELTITYLFDELGGNLTGPPITNYNVLRVRTLPAAARMGGAFSGWILTPPEQYKVGDPFVTSTNGQTTNLVLYALFSNATYTVRFISLLDGVTNPRVRTVRYGDDINFGHLVDPSGQFNFVGWYSHDGTETNEWGFEYVNGEPFLGLVDHYDEDLGKWVFVAQNTVLFARWEPK